MDALEKVYFFRQFDKRQLDGLKAITRILEVKSGYLILKQGHLSENLYIVRTGSVRVMVPMDDEAADTVPATASNTLAVLGPGQCFGEFAFIDGKPSSATVRANDDATLYSINHEQLDAFLRDDPTTAAIFYKAMLDVVVARLRNTDIELAIRKAIGG